GRPPDHRPGLAPPRPPPRAARDRSARYRWAGGRSARGRGAVIGPASVGCGLLVALAFLAVTRAGRRWPVAPWPTRGRPVGRGLRRPEGPVPSGDPPGLAEVAALAERIAGLVRAGMPPARVWTVLADRAGP